VSVALRADSDDDSRSDFWRAALILVTGVGSELRHPLGRAIVGSRSVSQIPTLCAILVVRVLFETLGERVGVRAIDSRLEAESP
jgi:hypothetical protein